MDKDQIIESLWEYSNHGTRREDIEAAYEAGAKAERSKWDKAEVRQFLIACSDSSMTRNNREQMADEILELLYGPNAALRGDSGLIAGVPLESTVMQQTGD